MKTKRILKEFLAVAVTSVLFMNTASYAASFPQSVWKPLEQYAAALDSGNNGTVYSLGTSLINIMEAEPDSQLKTEFLSGKYYQVANAADALGYFDAAVENYRKYIPYGEAMNETDGVIFAKSKIEVLTPRFEVFHRENGTYQPYYGARLEPENGVLFGAVYDNDPRIGGYDEQAVKNYFPKENSLNLVYLEFGEDISSLGRYEKYFGEIRNSGAYVMLAWNTYSSLGDIEQYDGYIRNTIEYLGSSGLNIILRFANEMNVGSNGDSAEDYIKSFRYVADIAHTKQNIAVCWAPNDVGALDRPFVNYYPGDEYVDWVGVSLYTSKYFQGIDSGTPEEKKISNTYFLTGEYADPVLKMGRIISFMNEYGIKKPVAVTECGAPHTTNNAAESCIEWGTDKLYKIYGELVRVYPQVKAICYFNVQRPTETQNYALSDSPALNEAYNRAVEDEIYLTDASERAGFSYVGGIPASISKNLEVSASVYYPGLEQGKVAYYIDGDCIGEAVNSPYKMNINADGLARGEHTLTVKLMNIGGYELLSRDYTFEVKKSIRVTLNGEELEFTDCEPIIQNGRVLVPFRAIFTALGADIEWNNDTKTVTSVKNDTTVKMTIGESVMYKNGTAEEIDVPAQIINGGRTVVPVRVVAKSFGAEVDWDDNTQTVIIVTK